MSDEVTPEILKTQVDLSGLMRVLGDHLYSTRRVVLRELVQNAHDSCTRRRMETDDDFEAQITVAVDTDAGTLSIEDNGAGLTREELIEYLATVGRGYTGHLRRAEEGEGPQALIGAFGLGFLSAYFVSEKVELFTTSYQTPDLGWVFASRGGERFRLAEIEPRATGTKVVLHLNDDASELADDEITFSLLEKYCGLLPVDIQMKGHGRVNVDPPWREPVSSVVKRRRDLLSFASRYEGLFEPVCTIELVPKGDNGVRGVLWIQDGWTFGTSDQRNVSVYVRGMLVSDDARELVPTWAGFVGGVIESAHLTPTASREDLLQDVPFLSAIDQIREALIEGLAAISRDQPAAWRRILTRHSEQLLGAALCDDRLFGLLAEELRVPTSEGELTVDAIRERSDGRIHVSLGEQGGYEEVLFRALRVPVVTGTRYAALPFCHAYGEKVGGTVVQLGTEEGNKQLFPAAMLAEADRASLLSLLSSPRRAVVLTRFEPTTLPAVLVPNRDAALKRRVEQDGADKRMSQGVLSLVRLHTAGIDGAVEARLYVNVGCPAVAALPTAPEPIRTQAAALIRSLAELMSSRTDEALELDMNATLDAMSGALSTLMGLSEEGG